jgi:DNA-binding GntR family transcriptional regulator
MVRWSDLGTLCRPVTQRPDLPANKHEFAYRAIRERIEDQVYRPGQRLVIDALARDLNMSQVPIREAIRRLQAEGWISYRRNSGPEVANVGLEQWHAMFEVLAVLEGYATALAAPHVRAEDIARLREIADGMRLALQEFDLLAFSAGNRDFHRVIYARCPNPVLVDRISETQAQLDTIRGTLFPSVPQRGAGSNEEHHHLIEMLERGDSFEAFEATAREHKLHFLQAAMRHLEDINRARRARHAELGNGFATTQQQPRAGAV